MVVIEKELKVRIDPEIKVQLREIAASETHYQGKVLKMLNHLKTLPKYKDNYRIMKLIEHLEPLYDVHDFWDSQPVPKAYETVDETMFDKAIDSEKTVAEVKQEPYTLPTGYYWADVDINDRVQAEEVYQLLT